MKIGLLLIVARNGRILSSQVSQQAQAHLLLRIAPSTTSVMSAECPVWISPLLVRAFKVLAF